MLMKTKILTHHNELTIEWMNEWTNEYGESFVPGVNWSLKKHMDAPGATDQPITPPANSSSEQLAQPAMLLHTYNPNMLQTEAGGSLFKVTWAQIEIDR